MTNSYSVAALEDRMRVSPEFLRLIADPRHAKAAYMLFVNRTWRHEPSGQIFECSWRYSGGMIASMRGQGETYLDYYMAEMLDDEWPRDLEIEEKALTDLFAKWGWEELFLEDVEPVTE